MCICLTFNRSQSITQRGYRANVLFFWRARVFGQRTGARLGARAKAKVGANIVGSGILNLDSSQHRDVETGRPTDGCVSDLGLHPLLSA
jgi:hypothetical protein